MTEGEGTERIAEFTASVKVKIRDPDVFDARPTASQPRRFAPRAAWRW
jgi:hypothetical protein